MDPDERPFKAEGENGAYRVTDGRGETVLRCSGAENAQQYAALLNRAYRAGYKAGYRAAKRAGS
ncbi:MAG: hypothetical protein JXR37_18270 [Kiritimatiellae bacterium]|nr:hypothetical protein [Kiritimatiellia bacterium]